MFVSILFFIFLFLLFLIIIGGSLLRGILNLLLGRRTPRSPYGEQGSGSTYQSGQNRRDTSAGGKKREKIFEDSEGEYVDFEEIKE
ncbi:MAG: DUF4834 family protein [Bacteroidales bacterium]|nr:DUF4834 family protein [Bacteroidales bacterium]